MSVKIPITHFAPAERVPIEVVQIQAASLADTPLAKDLLKSAPGFLLILNSQRQIVFATQNWAELEGVNNLGQLLGQRPGEAIQCEHAGELPGGCGTSESCQTCGMVKAILASLKGQTYVEEGRVTRVIDCARKSLDYVVYATPLRHKGEVYSLFSVTPVHRGRGRRRRERVLFEGVLDQPRDWATAAEQLRAHTPAFLQADVQRIHSDLSALLERARHRNNHSS